MQIYALLSHLLQLLLQSIRHLHNCLELAVEVFRMRECKVSLLIFITLILLLRLNLAELIFERSILVDIKQFNSPTSFPKTIQVSLAHATLSVRYHVSGQAVLLILSIASTVNSTIRQLVLAEAMPFVVDILPFIRLAIVPDVSTEARSATGEPLPDVVTSILPLHYAESFTFIFVPLAVIARAIRP